MVPHIIHQYHLENIIAKDKYKVEQYLAEVKLLIKQHCTKFWVEEGPSLPKDLYVHLTLRMSQCNLMLIETRATTRQRMELKKNYFSLDRISESSSLHLNCFKFNVLLLYSSRNLPNHQSVPSISSSTRWKTDTIYNVIPLWMIILNEYINDKIKKGEQIKREKKGIKEPRWYSTSMSLWWIL